MLVGVRRSLLKTKTPGAPIPGAEASAFLARTSGLSTQERNAFINLINGLVADGTWALMDILYVLATSSEANAWLNLKSASFSLTKTGSLTFAPDVGYTGDGATGYLSTNWDEGINGVNYTLNSASLGAYIRTAKTAADSSVIMGIGGGSAFSYMSPNNSGQVFNYDVNDFTFPSISTASAPGSQGAWIATRTSSGTVNLYRNGNSTPAGTASATTTVVNSGGNFPLLFALNNNSTPSNFSPLQASTFFFGGGLTGAQAAAVNNRFNTFMASFGASIY